MPTGVKRFYKVKVIAFRDLNGNGVQDPNEKGLDDMLIMFTKNDTVSNLITGDEDLNRMNKVYELVTNSKGIVEYDNIPVGDYVITAKPLTAMGGWFDGKTFYRTIDKNKVIYIPLSKGARISGGILMERAKFTDNKPIFLGNIRVTAVNIENGKTFSTLTDKEGQFVLFTPNGSYKVRINKAAVGSRFEFLQNDIPLNVTKDFENYNVSFYLVEKQRKINMGGNKHRPEIPVHRQNNNIGIGSDSLNQPASENPDYYPVAKLENDKSQWVIQIFAGEHPLEVKTTFNALSGIINVNCIEGPQGGYLYISEGYSKKSEAKKVLRKVKNAGFETAKVVPLVF